MRVYVGNLPVEAVDEQIEELFSQYGTVTFAMVVVDPETGQSMGFGFVEMPNEEEAQNAIKALDGSQFMGKKIRVHAVERRR